MGTFGLLFPRKRPADPTNSTMRNGSLATFLLLAVVAPAQTFVVDASNGPGTDYTSLATATAAAPSGSTLRIRAGSYAGFVIDAKSLALSGAEPTTGCDQVAVGAGAAGPAGRASSACSTASTSFGDTSPRNQRTCVLPSAWPRSASSASG